MMRKDASKTENEFGIHEKFVQSLTLPQAMGNDLSA